MGMRVRIVVPPPAELSTLNVPPRRNARSRIERLFHRLGGLYPHVFGLVATLPQFTHEEQGVVL
jgi:hypothetical protein